MKRQEENPKIPKKTSLRNEIHIFKILKFYLACSFLVFVDIRLSFSAPYEIKDKGEVMKSVSSTLKLLHCNF